MRGTTLLLYPEGEYPFESVVQDLVGPLNLEGSTKYILTLICRLTRFAETQILPDKSAESVAFGLFSAIFARHSYPKKILMDNGGEFSANIMEILENKYGIKHTFTAPYCPQSSGLIEAFNKVLGQNLRILSQTYEDWPRWVQMATHAHNVAIHTTTGVSPFTAIYFRDPQPTYQALSLIKEVKTTGEATVPLQMIAKTRKIFADYAKSYMNMIKEEMRK